MTQISYRTGIFWQSEYIFSSFLHFYRQKCAIFLLPVYLNYFRKKWVTRSPAEGDDFHKTWSWFDHPLPSYEALTANTLCYIVTLIFWPWTVTVNFLSHVLTLHQIWASCGDPFLSYDVHNLTTGINRVIAYWPLRMCNITWSICKGLVITTFLESLTLFVYSLCNLYGAMMNINKCYPPK